MSRQVGIGALIWNNLDNSRIKDVTFDWDTVLNFEGETGTYVQYTHARACSVLRKAAMDGAADYQRLDDAESAAVVSAIAAFPDAVREAMEKNEPYLVSRAVIAVCQAFNKFYYDCQIIVDDAALKNARLALTDAVRRTVAVGLNLLGIEAPARM